MNTGVKIFAPATVANVSVGFDILGFAIEQFGDVIKAKKGNGKGVSITAISGDNKKLPRDAMKNTAGYAAHKLLEFIGESDFPLELEIHKKMPLCSGLGSSAASAVAGAIAANEMTGGKMSREEIHKFAVMGEELVDNAWHADNVAPSLFGGIVLIRDNPSLDIVHLPVPKGLFVLIIHPHHQIPTIESRGVLSEDIKLSQHITQSGNLGAFVSSLYSSNFKLMKRSLQDIIVEPQRSKLIPEFDLVKEICMSEEAIGFGISGAGPSMFCFCQNTLIAESIQEKVKAHFAKVKMGCDLFISKINQTGAYKY